MAEGCSNPWRPPKAVVVPLIGVGSLLALATSWPLPTSASPSLRFHGTAAKISLHCLRVDVRCHRRVRIARSEAYLWGPPTFHCLPRPGQTVVTFEVKGHHSRRVTSDDKEAIKTHSERARPQGFQSTVQAAPLNANFKFIAIQWQMGRRCCHLSTLWLNLLATKLDYIVLG